MSGAPENPASEGRAQPPQPQQPERQHTGLSLWDLEKLPPVQRKVWRLILRDTQMAHPALMAAIDALPAEGRPSHGQVQEALEELIQQGWISREGKNPVVYKVVVRRKAAGVLTQSAQQGGGALPARNALNSLEQEEAREQNEPGQPRVKQAPPPQQGGSFFSHLIGALRGKKKDMK